MGNQVAANSDNKYVKTFATNSTVQKFAGKAVGVAATNKTVQQKVGQKVADEAKVQEANLVNQIGDQVKGHRPLPSNPPQGVQVEYPALHP